MTDDLRALSEAATPAPWHVRYDENYDGYQTGDIDEAFTVENGDYFSLSPENAALIVALRNAYAEGRLVERDEVDAAITDRDQWMLECAEYRQSCGILNAERDELTERIALLERENAELRAAIDKARRQIPPDYFDSKVWSKEASPDDPTPFLTQAKEASHD